MEETLYTMLGIGLAVLISIAIMLYQRTKRARSWEGVVTDIRRVHYQRDEDDIGGYDIKIRYKKTDGGTGKLSLDEPAFNHLLPDLKVGDRLIKEVGKDYPRISPIAKD